MHNQEITIASLIMLLLLPSVVGPGLPNPNRKMTCRSLVVKVGESLLKKTTKTRQILGDERNLLRKKIVIIIELWTRMTL